jgi:signal peptidase II
MNSKRSMFIYVVTAALVVFIVALDLWTKALVVVHLSPPDNGHPVPVIGEYLTLYYIQNTNSAMGLFTNRSLLIILTALALVVILWFYLHLLRLKPLVYHLPFGLILGGGGGNVIDRLHNGGYVVDFIFFRIPQLGFHFYVFYIADTAISLGVIWFLVLVLISSIVQNVDVTN